MADRPTPSVLQIFIFRDGEFLGTDMFSERRVVVGRDPAVADLVLESGQVSRKHATFEKDGDRVTVIDAGSTNGIQLNGRAIKSGQVTRLDEVVVGDFSLKIKLISKGQSEQPDRTAPAPTRVGSPQDVEDTPASVEAGDDPARSTRVDEPSGPKRRGGSANADLSDWDDVSDEHMRRPAKDPKPKAEFRDREEVMDRDRFGEVLEGIGISSSSTSSSTSSSKEEASKEVRAKAKEKSEPKAAPKPKPKRRSTPVTAQEQVIHPPSPIESMSDSELPSTDSLGPPREFAPGDDDEDEEESYEPPYSLAAQLVKEDPVVNKARRQGDVRVEVLTLMGDGVVGMDLVRKGGSFWIGPEVGWFRRRRSRDLSPRIRLLKVKRNGDCRIEVHKALTGYLQRDKLRKKIDAGSGDLEKDPRRGTFCMDFKDGEILDIVDGARTYHIRFATPPPPIRDGRPLLERLWPDKWISRALVLSVVGHFTAMAAAAVIMPAQALVNPSKVSDEFIDVSLETAPDLEEPPPEEPPPPEPKQAAVKKVPPKMEAAPSKRRRPRHGGTSKAPAGVLGLLNKKGSSAAPGPAAAVAAMSNLAAAKVPGSRSGYKVSGLIGKLPTSQLSVGGGGGGVNTKGGARLLRGGGGGAGRLSGKGSRRVGGLVMKNPRALKPRGQGQLGRDEIQKVINQNIGQIQRCYERELLKTSGLSGKVQIEWTIGTSGKVRTARQTFTSLRSTAVVSCIMGSIRSWRFPRPRGGEVIVNYPFIFKSVGF